jgi:hypothetical protein
MSGRREIPMLFRIPGLDGGPGMVILPDLPDDGDSDESEETNDRH